MTEEEIKLLKEIFLTLSAHRNEALAYPLIELIQKYENNKSTPATAPTGKSTPVPAPSGLDWIDPSKPTPQYNYSTTTTPNEEWQKSVRYM